MIRTLLDRIQDLERRVQALERGLGRAHATDTAPSPTLGIAPPESNANPLASKPVVPEPISAETAPVPAVEGVAAHAAARGVEVAGLELPVENAANKTRAWDVALLTGTGAKADDEAARGTLEERIGRR